MKKMFAIYVQLNCRKEIQKLNPLWLFHLCQKKNFSRYQIKFIGVAYTHNSSNSSIHNATKSFLRASKLFEVYLTNISSGWILSQHKYTNQPWTYSNVTRKQKTHGNIFHIESFSEIREIFYIFMDLITSSLKFSNICYIYLLEKSDISYKCNSFVLSRIVETKLQEILSYSWALKWRRKKKFEKFYSVF